MQPNDETGVLNVFEEPRDEDYEFDLSKNAVYLKMKATPVFKNIGKAFLQIPTAILPTTGARTVYVVHEVRSSHAGTQRRILGIHDSRPAAERQAAEARFAIERFLERYNGVPFGEESCGGTVLEYYHVGNPLAIVGFTVFVEEVSV